MDDPTMTEENKKQQEENKTSEEKSKKKGKEKALKITESEHQQLLDEASEYKDKYFRLYAEFENARKRMEREKQEFVKFANENVFTELLNVVDHLELSIKAAQSNPEDIKNLLKGIEMVLANAHDLLKRNGVMPIETTGKAFDPNCHEILLQEESKEKEGTILEELQRGYMYNDRVLRTSKVKIAAPKESGA